MQLVEDDVAESHEKGLPPSVVRKDPDVQHVRVGEHHVGVAPGPRALVGRGVAVVGDGDQTGHVQAPKGAELVLGQGLGGEHEEGRTRLIVEDGLGDRELVAERLARRRSRRHRDRTTLPRQVDGGRLVRPQAPFGHQIR